MTFTKPAKRTHRSIAKQNRFRPSAIQILRRLHVLVVTYAIACTVVLILLTIGCESSPTSRAAVIDTDSSDGALILDAIDDRRIPKACTTGEECDDGDPCTIDKCDSFGDCSGLETATCCRYTTKNISLEPVLISTRAAVLDIAIRGNYLMVALGQLGVDVFNISDLANVELIQSIATADEALSVTSWGSNVVVAEGEYGIEGFQVPSGEKIGEVLMGNASLGYLETALDVTIGSNQSIISGYADGVAITNNDDWNSYLGEYNTVGRAVAVAMPNNARALIADSLGGTVSLILTGDNAPRLAGVVPTDGRVVDVAASRDTALIAEYGTGFSLIDYSNGETPERLAIVATPAPSIGVSLLGRQTGVVLLENGSLTVYSLFLNQPPQPIATGSIAAGSTTTKPTDITIYQDLIGVGHSDNGVALFDTQCIEEETP